MGFSKELKFGIIQTVAFYIFGVASAWVIYLIFGHPYIHAPGIHHIAIVLTFLIGSSWALISIILFYSKQKTDKLRGIIMTNLIFILTLIMYFSFLINF